MDRSSEDAAARRAVLAALAGLRPVVTESHDGLTLVVLAPGGRVGGGSADLAAAFLPPPGAIGVAVGLYDRLVAVESFADAEELAAAWPELVAAVARAWTAQRDAIASRRAPVPGRLRPDDGAPDRLLRRAAVAVRSVPDEGDASGPPDDLTVPIRGERVEGSARVVDGRVVRLSLHRREPFDPPDGLVP